MAVVVYFYFLFFFSLTGFFVFKGYDDVQYRVVGKRPTPEEGLHRILFVLSKLFTSLQGGRILIYVTFGFLTKKYDMSKFHKIYIIFIYLFFMMIAFYIASLAQIAVRKIMGKKIYPIIDWNLLKNNLLGFFK